MTKPKVLLVGAGRFGQHYLRIFKTYETQGLVDLVGVCVRSTLHAEAIRSEHSVPVFTEVTDELLDSADVVFIVTPPETHYELVKTCLPRAHVFVEKPLAFSAREAAELVEIEAASPYQLTVGHILRFHPLTKHLQTVLGNEAPPQEIRGLFVNPLVSDQGRDASFELLHLYDVVDYIWPHLPITQQYRRDTGRVAKIMLRYGTDVVAHYELGWLGEGKTRTLTFKYPDRIVTADFGAGEVAVFRDGQKEVLSFAPENELLEIEIQAFLSAIAGDKESVVPAAIGGKIVAIAERVSEVLERKTVVRQKPRVAVIGGGVFGTNAALELAPFCDVVLFEKHNDVLQEGTRVNQFRHHAGYHYPRSDETVWDVQKSTASFEAHYEPALIRTIPTYYGVARLGSQVDEGAFLTFCDKHQLPYEVVDTHLFSSESVGMVVRVVEPSYHYETLYALTKRRLAGVSVEVRTGTVVSGLTITENGRKRLEYEAGGLLQAEEFDVVVNTTYAAVNDFTQWLNFARIPIRIDLAEVLIVDLPVPPVSLTVIDGPFATLMPTGNPNEFTLYHVVESILDRYTPENGLVKPVIPIESNWEAIYRESMRYFPVLKNATIKESRVVNRGVQAYREHDDSRVAELYDHGFDCYSMLSGKIVSSVSIAERLAGILRQHYPTID